MLASRPSTSLTAVTHSSAARRGLLRNPSIESTARSSATNTLDDADAVGSRSLGAACACGDEERVRLDRFEGVRGVARVALVLAALALAVWARAVLSLGVLALGFLALGFLAPGFLARGVLRRVRGGGWLASTVISACSGVGTGRIDSRVGGT